MGGPPEVEFQDAKSPWEDTWCCCGWLKSLEGRGGRGGEGRRRQHKGDERGIREDLNNSNFMYCVGRGPRFITKKWLADWLVDSRKAESEMHIKGRDQLFKGPSMWEGD